MKTNHLLHLVLVLAVAGLALASCKKDEPNPPTQDLPAKDFSYTLTEKRQMKEFTWQSVNGSLTNGEEKINSLFVTAYNEVSLNVTADVNVKSDKPEYVLVSKSSSSNQSFKLSYKGDGPATIILWNGTEGKDKIEKKFVVTGKDVIDVTGLRFTYGPSKNHLENEEIIFSRYSTSRPPLRCNFPDDTKNEDAPGRPTTSDFMCLPYWKPNIWNEEKQRFVDDPTQGAQLYFEGLEPENASFRTVTAFESEWDVYRGLSKTIMNIGCFNEGDYKLLPNEHECNKDVSQFTSRPVATWTTYTNDVYFCCVKIPVASGARFYYVYRAKEEAYPMP